MTSIDIRPHARGAGEVLSATRALVEPALRAAVDTLPPPARHIAGYHLGWWDSQGEADSASSAGKVIRPALVLLAAQATHREGVAAALPAAVAVELVHNHSLLHDDVIDGDRTRRHRATAWTAFGIGDAILAGDALLMLATDVLSAGDSPAAKPALRMLGGAVQTLVEGQFTDLALESRPDADVAACADMSLAKTGALMGCACALGCLLSGGAAERVEHFRRFGEHLGLAFQHTDDLLGIWGDPAATGKPVHSDLRNRKKSLPVVYALRSGTPAGRELAGLYEDRRALSDRELGRAAELVEAAGGRGWSQAQADAQLTTGLQHLRATSPREPAAAELTALARLVTRRDH